MEKITPIELHYLFAVISWRLRRTTNRDEEFHLEKIKEKLHKLTEQSSGNPAVELSVNFEQELDKAREEGREEVRQLLRDKKQMQKFLKENPKFYKGKKIETTGVATLTKF